MPNAKSCHGKHAVSRKRIRTGGPPTTPILNPYSTDFPTTSSTSTRNQQPHRAGLILALGIASLACNFCFIPGILAWILGKQDMRKMDQGGHGL